MVDWWLALGDVGQIFACIAIPATVILIVQLILTLIGLGGDDADASAENEVDLDDGDTDGDIDAGLRVFTLRGLVAFFSVLGWVGIICIGEGLSVIVSVLIAVAAGALATVSIALIMSWLFKLQYDGTEDIRDALGVSGTVYLRIPPSRTGKGKISAIIQGKLSEKSAVTDEETVIERGEEVTVVGISGEETLIVKRKNII